MKSNLEEDTAVKAFHGDKHDTNKVNYSVPKIYVEYLNTFAFKNLIIIKKEVYRKGHKNL
jgi:hypothetical protein